MKRAKIVKIEVCRKLQDYCYSLRNENGRWRTIPIGLIGNVHLSTTQLSRVKNILNIILNSDNISIDTKLYILNYRSTIKEVNANYNREARNRALLLGKTHKDMCYNSTLNHVAKDETALIKCVGKDFFTDIVYNPNKLSGRAYSDKLSCLIQDFGVYDGKRENLMLHIDKNKVQYNGVVNHEKFFNTLERLRPYIVKVRDSMEDEINHDREFVEYFNYLLSTAGIQDETVTNDRDRLLRFLNGEDTEQTEMEEVQQEVQQEVKDSQKEAEIGQAEVETLQKEVEVKQVEVEEALMTSEVNKENEMITLEENGHTTGEMDKVHSREEAKTQQDSKDNLLDDFELESEPLENEGIAQPNVSDIINKFDITQEVGDNNSKSSEGTEETINFDDVIV